MGSGWGPGSGAKSQLCPQLAGSPWAGLFSRLCLGFPSCKQGLTMGPAPCCEDSEPALSRPELVSARRGKRPDGQLLVMCLQGVVKLFPLCCLLETFHHKKKVNV